MTGRNVPDNAPATKITLFAAASPPPNTATDDEPFAVLSAKERTTRHAAFMLSAAVGFAGLALEALWSRRFGAVQRALIAWAPVDPTTMPRCPCLLCLLCRNAGGVPCIERTSHLRVGLTRELVARDQADRNYVQ